MAELDEEAFGKVLYSGYSAYSFSRIPHLFKGPRYFITTKGLVIRGGQKGEGDLLTWEKMKEPGTMDGTRYAGIDFSGTVKFSTPITLLGKDGNKQEFPKMKTRFYKKLMQAWNVANMFSDNKINQEIALTIWGTRGTRPLKSQKEYIQKVYETKIKNLFKYQTQEQNIVIEMYRKRYLTEKAIDEKSVFEIEEEIEKYKNKIKDRQNSNNGENDFRDSLHTDVGEGISHLRAGRGRYKPMKDFSRDRE